MSRNYANAIWCTRLEFDRPYQSVEVDKTDDSRLAIGLWPGKSQAGHKFTIKRADARLLAKRINQCLNATVKS